LVEVRPRDTYRGCNNTIGAEKQSYREEVSVWNQSKFHAEITL
jgi:hypothetical protein